jgi:hypothetical protein
VWQDKKFFVIVGLLVVIIALGGTLGGIALARQNTNNRPLTNIPRTVLPDRPLNQDQNVTKNELLDNLLQKLIDEGKITQEEADQFKAWLEARPNIPSDELKQWLESRPDLPNLFNQADEGSNQFFGLQGNN